jgi:hypothetical protein
VLLPIWPFRVQSLILIHSHSSFLLLHDIIYFLYAGLIIRVIDACLVLRLSIELNYASRAISARLAACPRTRQQQSALSAVSTRHIQSVYFAQSLHLGSGSVALTPTQIPHTLVTNPMQPRVACRHHVIAEADQTLHKPQLALLTVSRQNQIYENCPPSRAR